MKELILNEQALAGLLKQGVAEMRVTVQQLDKAIKERDVLLKFARAVEILPTLEKAAAIHFPEGLPFAEKALLLAKKSSAELEKLAYMADHLPNTIADVAKVAEGKSVMKDSGVGELTQRLLCING